MGKFEEVALKYFETQVPKGMLQRIDGVACFSPLSDFWFWKFRLNRMVKKGILTKRATGSFWPSLDGMPAYGVVYK